MIVKGVKQHHQVADATAVMREAVIIGTRHYVLNTFVCRGASNTATEKGKKRGEIMDWRLISAVPNLAAAPFGAMYRSAADRRELHASQPDTRSLVWMPYPHISVASFLMRSGLPSLQSELFMTQFAGAIIRIIPGGLLLLPLGSNAGTTYQNLYDHCH